MLPEKHPTAIDRMQGFSHSSPLPHSSILTAIISGTAEFKRQPHSGSVPDVITKIQIIFNLVDRSTA